MATMHGAGDAEPNDPSLGDLAKGVAQDASTLVRQEIELAKLELRGKARTAAPGVAMLAAAAVVGLAVLGALTATLILLLDLVLTTWLAAVIVTAFWAVVAGALGLAGRSRLRAAGRPIPEQTMNSVQEDVAVAKNAARSETGDGSVSRTNRNGN